MQTRTEHVESLLLDGVFDIPEYQRSYSWEERQLNELIDDLRYLPEDRTHFFGNVILDKKDEPYETASGRRLNVYQVVDGQQRLTSTLILLDVISELDQAVQESVQEGNVIHVPNGRPRLLPQNQDQEFFRDRILGDLSLSPDVPSQHRLKQARGFLYDRLSELQDEIDISTLATRLLYDFEINVVEVDDDSEAASIFESINDRGKPLSSLEKTKSFLMYMDDRANAEKSLQTQINDRFGGIYQELFVLEEGHSRVGDFDEDSFQQAHWGLYDGYDTEEYFNSLDTLKSRIYETYRSGEYDHVESIIDEYTSSLREASIAFAAIFDPASYSSNRVRDRLTRLLELGRVANVLPILMAAQLEYGEDAPDRFADIIEKCETFVFRVYAIDRRRSDTARGQLVRLAHRMYTDPDHEFEDTIRRLEEITRQYTDDDRFKRELRDPDFYTTISSRDVRYLLYQYDQQLEAETEEFVRHDLHQILSSDFQVEHILAQQLAEEYIPTESRDEYQEHVHRLGNLTIAGRYWNSTYGALPFEEKKQLPKTTGSTREKAYETSSLKVQHVLASVEDFDLDAIDAREEQIVDFALEEWALESAPADAIDVEGILETAEELVAEGSAESTELDLSETEFFVLAAVLKRPGWALRSVHRTAASFDGSPIEWTDSWSTERTNVQSALRSLRKKELVRLEQRSWYPEGEPE
jgi:hypothetical protein